MSQQFYAAKKTLFSALGISASLFTASTFYSLHSIADSDFPGPEAFTTIQLPNPTTGKLEPVRVKITVTPATITEDQITHQLENQPEPTVVLETPESQENGPTTEHINVTYKPSGAHAQTETASVNVQQNLGLVARIKKELKLLDGELNPFKFAHMVNNLDGAEKTELNGPRTRMAKAMAILIAMPLATAVVFWKFKENPGFNNIYDLSFFLSTAIAVSVVIGVREFMTNKYSMQHLMSVNRPGERASNLSIFLRFVGIEAIMATLVKATILFAPWMLVALSGHLDANFQLNLLMADPNIGQVTQQQITDGLGSIATMIATYVPLSSIIKKLTDAKYTENKNGQRRFEMTTFFIKQIFKNIFMAGITLSLFSIYIDLNQSFFAGIPLLEYIKHSVLLLFAMNLGIIHVLDPTYLPTRIKKGLNRLFSCGTLLKNQLFSLNRRGQNP